MLIKAIALLSRGFKKTLNILGEAKLVMTEVKIKYVDGLQFVGESSSGHAVVIDGDIEIGGNDTGPRPGELLLIALGSCAAMGAVSILKKKQQVITGFEVRLKGIKEDEWPKRIKDIEIELTITGDNLSEEAVRRSLELSFEKYCTVKATLQTPPSINYSYRIIQNKTASKKDVQKKLTSKEK